MQSSLVRIIKVLIGITLFIPLVLVQSTFIFPYIVPKVLLFRSLVVVMAGVCAVVAVSAWKKYGIQKTPLHLALYAFLLSSIVSTVVGVDWFHSLWDSHERMLGLFTVAHFFVFFLVCASILRQREDWRWLLRLFLLSGSVVMGIALIQQFVPDFVLNHGNPRSISTLGNPIYVGGFGLLLAFLGALVSVQEKSRGWRWYAYISAVLGLSGIFSSVTRGAVVGLGVGLLVVWVYDMMFLESAHIRARFRVVTVVGVACCLGLLFFRDSQFVRHIPAVGSLVNIKVSEGTSITRLMAWSAAVDGWKDKPFFGWGPSNFMYAFNAHYRPEFLEHGWGETWFDNAHNVFFNTLTTQGVVGVITYGAIYIVAWWVLFRAYREGRVSVHEAGILSALFAAHVAQNMFVFENPTSFLSFFFLLAYTAVITQPPSSDAESPQAISIPLAAILFFVAFVVIYTTDVNPARANANMFVVIKQLYALEDPSARYALVRQIATPHMDDVRSEFARLASGAASAYIKKGQQGLAKKLVQQAYDDLGQNIVEHPLDVRYHLQQAETAQVSASIFHQIDLAVQSEKDLTETLALSPRRQQIYFDLAWVKLVLGKPQEAIDQLTKALADDDRIGEIWWRLALMYQSTHQGSKAQDTVREARQKGIVFDGQGLSVVNRILPPETNTSTLHF